MQRHRLHEIALCLQASFPFRECNLPENILTKHYIINGQFHRLLDTFSRKDLQPKSDIVHVCEEWANKSRLLGTCDKIIIFQNKTLLGMCVLVYLLVVPRTQNNIDHHPVHYNNLGGPGRSEGTV